MNMSFTGDLPAVVREVEQHVAAGGWDQPTRLFAIVPTAALLESDPTLTLSGELALTSIEQELEDVSVTLDELLGHIAWPDDVVGAIVVVERIVLPPEAQDELPDENDAHLIAAVADHPDRRDVRMVSAVLRTGSNMNALRYRLHDEPDSVAIAPDLVPQLNDALAATFA